MTERRLSLDWKLFFLLLLLVLSNLASTQKEGEESCECDENETLKISVSPNPVTLNQGGSQDVALMIVGGDGSRVFDWTLVVTPWEGIVKAFNIFGPGFHEATLNLEAKSDFGFDKERETTALIVARNPSNEVGPFERWLTIRGRPMRLSRHPLTLSQFSGSFAVDLFLSNGDNAKSVEIINQGLKNLVTPDGDLLRTLFEVEEIIPEKKHWKIHYRADGPGIEGLAQLGSFDCAKRSTFSGKGQTLEFCQSVPVTHQILARVTLSSGEQVEIRQSFPVGVMWFVDES